ncbi:MAG: sigma 54-interacting transcriptional regulator, partial [Gemmatimonadetes bacterium]|nr:sigma 54-interacting transcriptional regulator [Gemmatimonadota bacterium]
DMTPETQARMLRLLEEGTFERVGGTQTLKSQTRIMAATNRDLKDMVNEGDFREDLYYRLNAFPMYLPPLRERTEDIPGLAEFFKNRMAAHIGKQIGALIPEVIEVLQTCDWPGNVRELEHTIQRAVIACHGSQIKVSDLGLYGSRREGIALDLEINTIDQDREVVPLEDFERRYILKVLKITDWRVSGPRGAAILLGLPPTTLYSKIKKLRIKRP